MAYPMVILGSTLFFYFLLFIYIYACAVCPQTHRYKLYYGRLDSIPTDGPNRDTHITADIFWEKKNHVLEPLLIKLIQFKVLKCVVHLCVCVCVKLNCLIFNITKLNTFLLTIEVNCWNTFENNFEDWNP